MLAGSWSASVNGATATLQWRASADPAIAGYRVHSTPVSGSATTVLDAGNATSMAIASLVEGQSYSFFVTAYTTGGIESDPSSLVTFTVPVTVPVTTTANTAPTLGLLQNQVVIEGNTLQFKVSAMDSDLPAQTLTFSLGAGAPVGASIDPVTGVFSWTPTSAQIPSIRTVSVTVTDSGSPALSATGVFSVTAAKAGTYYTLKMGGFGHGTVRYTPRGTMSGSGEKYVAGTAVTLTATAGTGYQFAGWTINSSPYSSNPIVVTMNANTTVTPSFTKVGGTAPAAATEISLGIKTANGGPTLQIGGELGAWVVEGSTDFKNWIDIAIGLTSDTKTVSANGGYAFYRVHSQPLLPFEP
jgi:hypothetical protein